MSGETDLRKQRGIKTRQKILNSARELLFAEGPEALTAGRLTSKAGVSKASLFHHFDHIDEVLTAVLEEVINGFDFELKSRDLESVSEYVFSIGEAIAQVTDEQRKASAALLHFYQRSARDEKFRALHEKLVHLILQNFEAGLEKSAGRPLTAHQKKVLPLLIAMSLEGMGVLAIVLSDASRFRAVWKTFSESIDILLEESSTQESTKKGK